MSPATPSRLAIGVYREEFKNGRPEEDHTNEPNSLFKQMEGWGRVREPSEGHRRKGEESRLSWLWSEWTLVRVDLGGHSGIESSYKP